MIELDDLLGFESLAPVNAFHYDAEGLSLLHSDGSEARVVVLAPDLIRVRLMPKGPIERDRYSPAIAKHEWAPVQWGVQELPDRLTVLTGALELRIARPSGLTELLDRKSGRTIVADARPVQIDPRSAACAVVKKLGFDEHFFGLGEKAFPLDRRRGRFVQWNTDAWDHRLGSDPLYQSINFYLGWDRGSAYGVFFDNSGRTVFDFGSRQPDEVRMIAQAGELDLYFFGGPSLKSVVARFTELTGRAPLWPRWALGVHQSRWSYAPAEQVEALAAEFEARDLPLEAIHLDIDHLDGLRVFTWDERRFPDPKGMIERLQARGIKVVSIVDPGIKKEPGFPIFDRALEDRLLLVDGDGEVYTGVVWPGESVFPDFSLKETRGWWGELHRGYVEAGVAGIWNDMNEPSDFSDQTGKRQAAVLFRGEGGGAYDRCRNLYALLECEATYRGLEALAPDRRPFVITRAAYAGIQRFATTWTGDNESTFESLALGIPMFNSMGLSGESFVGGDIGGFRGRADGELLARWYQVGFLSPFCRNHSIRSGIDQEPWRFGEPYLSIIRSFLKLRVRLLPYLYTLVEEAHRTGIPLLRPLVLEHQDDPNTLSIDDQYLLGSDLLAAPVLERGARSRELYLPRGEWIDWWSHEHYVGGHRIEVAAPLERTPLFVRAGAIIPLGPERTNAATERFDPLTLMIHLDPSGRAETSFYEDDGSTHAHREGLFRRTRVRAVESGGVVEVELAPEGPFDPGPRKIELVIAGDPDRSVSIDDAKLLQRAKV